MKSIPHLLMLLTIGAFLACNQASRDASIPSGNTVNTSLNTDANDAFSSEDYMQESGHDSSVELKAKVQLRKNEKILEVINTNIDADQPDEQIVVTSDTNDPSTPLKLAIIDYDDVRNIYAKSWESLSNATNPRIFNIEILDVTGDFNREIALHGMNARDLTLDILKRSPSLSKPGLHFQPICQIISDGMIRIKKIERSSEYEMGTRHGESFPVIVERRDLDSKNELDLIEETYEWIAATGRYELKSKRQIPADVASQQKLSSLFSSSTEESFIKFIKGTWFDKSNKEKMVSFDPDAEQLIFSLGNVQEIYQWDFSKRTLYNGMLIIAHNILIKSIKINVSVTARALNSISLFLEDETWTGEYQKYNNWLVEDEVVPTTDTVKPALIQISGIFEDEFKDNKETNQIDFEPPYFTWTKQSGSFYGNFSLIENLPVLNDLYYKTSLQFVPKEIDNNMFTNTIRKKIDSDADDDLLSTCYMFDRKDNVFVLNQDLTRKELERLWKLLVSVQYKGYSDYFSGVLTIKVLKENDLVDRIENYIIEYLEKKEQNRTVRSMILTPAKLSIKGIEAVSKDSIRLVQVAH